MLPPRVVALGLLALTACPPAGKDPEVREHPTSTESHGTAQPSSSGAVVTDGKAVVSVAVVEKGLRVFFVILPEVHVDRIPMRTVMLHFKNESSDPLRIYIPQAEAFRAGISSLTFVGTDAPLFVPEPRPHGYTVTEVDFPLLGPGEEKTYEQTFSLDPMTPGSGTSTARRKGFEPGTRVKVSWTYENSIVKWAGGVQTLDGPTKELFGGKDIPHIWTGKLSTDVEWIAP